MSATDTAEARGPWASRLLLSLLREDAEAVQRIVREGEDWPAFIRLVSRQGIGPWLAAPRGTAGGAAAGAETESAAEAADGSVASRLGPEVAERLGGLPDEVLSFLQETRRKTAYDNVLLLAQAQPVMAALAERGIVPLVLKGWTLMGRVYPDPAARIVSDIDLLVPAERAAESARLLEEIGLRHLPDEQRAARRTGFEADRPGSIPVEMHWDLSQRYRYQADLEGVWERSLPFEFEGIPARRLAPADEFLYLCLHYAAHYFGPTLKWLVDLRELLRIDPPDPEELAARARLWRGTAGLHFALRYLRQVYPDLPYPDRLDRAVARPIRDRLIVPYLSDDPLLLVDERARGPAKLLLGLLFMDRPSDMVRLGWAALVRRGDDPDHAPPQN